MASQNGRHVCPTCGSDRAAFDHARGEIVCAVCGTVIAENLIDPGPEWGASGDEDKAKKRRVGAPIAIPTSEAFTTTIDGSNRDAKGESLDFKRRALAQGLRDWQQKLRALAGHERNLIEAAREMERLRSLMGIPKPCVERALEIFREASARGLMRGQPLAAAATAALYYACRMANKPRQLNEFAKYAKASRRAIARCFNLLVDGLNAKIPLIDPTVYIARIAERLGLPGDVARTAMWILRKAKMAGLTAGRDPAGIAAAAAYLAARLHGIDKSQKEFAMAAGMTEVTVRNGYRRFAKALGITALGDNTPK